MLGLVEAIVSYSTRSSAIGLFDRVPSLLFESLRQRLASELSSAFNIGVEVKQFASHLLRAEKSPQPKPSLGRSPIGNAEFQQPARQAGRWWIVALCVTIVAAGLAALLYMNPESVWLWILAGGVVLYAIVLSFNPRYRYWRRANLCFGTASVLAFVPTIIAKAKLERIGAFEFVSDSSPLVVLGFLAAGLYLAWLDSRADSSFSANTGSVSTNDNLQPLNSHNTVTGLTAGGNIIVNQGISEDTFLAVMDAIRISEKIKASTAVADHDVDEDLVWRLIDDIKDARRKLERDQVDKLLASLQKCFERSGSQWSKKLRTESLLIMAEEERSEISSLRQVGKQVDLTRLQKLLKELHDE